MYPVLADNLFALLPEVILSCLVLAQPLNIGPSRLWVPLLGTVYHLKSALFHKICLARFTSSLELLFSNGPREPLSSYLEVVLYKFHRDKRWQSKHSSLDKAICQLIRGNGYLVTEIWVLNLKKWGIVKRREKFLLKP